MQKEQPSVEIERSKEDETQRTRRFLDYLSDLWQRPHEPSAASLKEITEIVLAFEEPYRSTGLQLLAEQLVSNMSLHYLELIAVFKKKAAQENIDEEEVEGTLEDIKSDLSKMMELRKHISVASIDELVKISNATIGWYRSSQTCSANDARWWLYSLPRAYSNKLLEENILSKQPQNSQK